MIISRQPLLLSILIAVAAITVSGCKKSDDGKDTPKADTVKEATPTTAVTPKTPEAPAGAGSLAAAAGSFTLDSVHSTALFRVNHLGVSYTYGRFNKITGKMVLDPDPAKSSISVEIDANSIFTADKKRDEHLRGPDFFNTSQFPTLTFTSKSVRAVDEKTYEVTGDLSMHGVTKSITANFEHVGSTISPLDNKSFLTGFDGTFTIDRTDFGMNYMPEAIGVQVDVTFSIEAVRD